MTGKKKQYRNKGKADFSKAYTSWVKKGRMGEMPDFKKFGISYMAAQSIWMGW